MNPDTPVTADELHAYVDGELAPDRLDAVQAWLDTHPDDAAQVAAWRSIAAAVHARYDGVADEAVPKRLELDQLARQPRRWPLAAAAAALAFLIGSGAGWTVRNSTVPPQPLPTATLTGDALDAHRLYSAEVRHPVEVVAAEKQHMVQWLSRRVGYPVPAPELDDKGLKLVGGRLLPGQQAPAALIMYEATSGERFTVYCSKSAGANTQMRFQSRDRNAAVTWSDNGMGFVVSGPNDHDRIKQVAEMIYDQVEKTGAPGKN